MGGCLIKLLLCNCKLCFRKTFSEVAVPSNLTGICTEVFWIPEITPYLYLSPSLERFRCLPLDGYTESSFAGSRATRPLTSVRNLLGIFSFSLLFSLLTMQCSWASQAKKSCSVEAAESHCLGGASLKPCSKSNKVIHLILVSFSTTLLVKAVLKLYVATSRLKEYPPVLHAADLNTSPCYAADIKPGVVLCRLCYTGCLAIVLQHLIVDLCLTGSPAVPLWSRAGVGTWVCFL